MSAVGSDDELFRLARDRLFSAVIGDVLDVMGFYNQTLPARIRAIEPDMVVIGRAMPVLVKDVTGPQSTPFGLLTEALDQLRPGEVYLAAGGHNECAAWGEILTAVAKGNGAVGAVVDGYHRDTNGILAQSWPVFSQGAYSQDAGVRSSVSDYRVAVTIGGVRVDVGDLVFGDRDGVVVIPQRVEADVVERAVGKVDAERQVRQAIREGMSASVAYATYGVL